MLTSLVMDTCGFRPLYEHVWHKVSVKGERQVKYGVWEQVAVQIWDQVQDQIRDQVERFLRERIDAH